MIFPDSRAAPACVSRWRCQRSTPQCRPSTPPASGTIQTAPRSHRRASAPGTPATIRHTATGETKPPRPAVTATTDRAACWQSSEGTAQPPARGRLSPPPSVCRAATQASAGQSRDCPTSRTQTGSPGTDNSTLEMAETLAPSRSRSIHAPPAPPLPTPAAQTARSAP